ncbi:MAG: glycosyltransferase family 39 protein [Elusimicrobiota bacterium]|nr:glycosyltransferase family 39 protein [Elusimicrobiota bacterium]
MNKDSALGRGIAAKAAAAILAGTVLRLLLLGAKSLWFDEASTLLLAGRPLAELVPLLVSNEINPPLYYALMHFWMQPFSDPRFGLRLFSALCAVASLFAFRSLAHRLLPERARLPALALAAFSSFWIHVAQDGRTYSLLLLISLLSSRTVLELTEGRPRARLWAAYAALAALGLYTHYYFAILLAGHAVWLARRSDVRGFLLAHAAAALAFAPWLPTLAAQLRAHVGDAVVGEALTFPRVLDLLGTTFFDVTFLGLALPAWTGIAVGAGFAALAASAARDALSSEEGSPERRAFGFCLVHVAAALALVAAVELWSGRPVTQARYFTPLSPVLILLAALGARRTWARGAAGVVVAAGCAGYFFSAVMIDPRLDALAAVIRRSSDASVPVVHLGKYYYLPMRVYYLPERRHLLVAAQADGMDYRGMPPYPGVIEDKDLPALGPCVVVDQGRTLSLERVTFATGAQLAELRR